MKNLIHLQHPQFEVMLDLDQITYANRIDNAVWLHFTGDTKPLQLRGGMADAIWKILSDSKLTVYIDSAAVGNKNAENPTADGSGDLSNNDHEVKQP